MWLTLNHIRLLKNINDPKMSFYKKWYILCWWTNLSLERFQLRQAKKRPLYWTNWLRIHRSYLLSKDNYYIELAQIENFFIVIGRRLQFFPQNLKYY